MKRSRFSEEQIIGILKEHAAGLSAMELCRKHEISDATFYKWRSKYGGMEVSEAKRLKALEDENAKLKKLVAELEEALPCLSGGAADGPQARRQASPGDRSADDHSPGSEPALEPGLRLRHAGRWPSVPDPLRHRRLQPGMPGNGYRQLDLGPPRLSRVGRHCRASWLSLSGGQR